MFCSLFYTPPLTAFQFKLIKCMQSQSPKSDSRQVSILRTMSESCDFLWWSSFVLFHMFLCSRMLILKFLSLTEGLNTLVVFERKYVNVRAIAINSVFGVLYWCSFAKFMFMPYYTAVCSLEINFYTYKEIWNVVTSDSDCTQCIFLADLQYRIWWMFY